MKLLYGALLVGLLVFRPAEEIHSFLPPNNMYIGPDQFSFKGMNESTFNQVIGSVEQVYSPIISRQGGNLIVQKLWADGKVNAEALRQGTSYIVRIYGGLARHEAITNDGLAVVVCHEIGHHIGGAPKMTKPGGFWASVEGQSDYWATLKCLRKVWKSANNQEIIQQQGVDPLAEKKCNETYGIGSAESYLCMRSIMAAESVAKLFANGGSPRLDTPDLSKVTQTFEDHPQAQCRLDTYVQGALCKVSDDVDVSQTNVASGTCTDRKVEGPRPLCWYYDSGSTGGGGGILTAATPTFNGSTEYVTSSPYEVINFYYNIANIPGAAIIFIEISYPNEPFPNPNGREPSPRRLWGGGARSLQGTLQLQPGRLPQRGVYYFRAIALDNYGNPVSNFSNSAVLKFQ